MCWYKWPRFSPPARQSLLFNIRTVLTRPSFHIRLPTMTKASSPKSSSRSFRRKPAKTKALGKVAVRSLSSLKRVNNMTKEACATCRKLKKKCTPRSDAACEECAKHHRHCLMERGLLRPHPPSPTRGDAELQQMSATSVTDVGNSEYDWEEVSDITSVYATSGTHNRISKRLPSTTPTPTSSPYVVNPPELHSSPLEVPLTFPFITIERPRPLWFGHDFNDVAPTSNARADEEDAPAYGRLRLVRLGEDDFAAA